MMVSNISLGLTIIHHHNYQHKDFHSGNILFNISHHIRSMISDFGMSRPANESSKNKAVYGVIPFVAPEVLRGWEYTDKADVYGLGMIMWEIMSGEPPFIDREYDQYLMRDICLNQLRPPIPEYAPEPYVTLMQQCWDPIPDNRPTSKELKTLIFEWFKITKEQEEWKEREDQWK